jgi:uncharacterized membrane protein
MLFALLLLMLPSSLFAQELITETSEVMRAEVVQVVGQEQAIVPGTDIPATYQTLDALILDGVQEGHRIRLENDHLRLEEGNVFYVRHTKAGMGTEYYMVMEPYRLPQLLFLAALFFLSVAIFGGAQGLRGLASLVGSIIFIIYVLLPAMLAGYSPIAVSIACASVIVILGSYITHGFSRMTTTAVLGMIVTIILSGLLAWFAIHWTRMTGFAAEEATYLLLNTRGAIDLAGLYLGGILIGLLGVLYDAAIGQSVAVDELRRADPQASSQHIVARALRMGREHIGALVNTLAIAYVGASLPLLLFIYGAQVDDIYELINREIFASEIVRIIVSSIGIILVVPITTIIAAALIKKSGSTLRSYHVH